MSLKTGYGFNSQGLTLLELLVAIAIFGVLAAMAYSGLNQVLNTTRYAAAQIERMTQIQMAFSTLSRDFIQVVNRPVRDEYGDMGLSLIGGGMRGQIRIEFTRGGWRNPAGFSRASLQRIGYTVQEGWLTRLSWWVLDRAQDSLPLVQPLLNQVKGVTFRFLDDANAWQQQWPPAQNRDPNLPAPALPKAIEVILDLRDFGPINRLYPLPAVFIPAAQRPGLLQQNVPKR